MGTSYESVEHIKHEMVRLSSVRQWKLLQGPGLEGQRKRWLVLPEPKSQGYLVRAEVIEIVGSWDHRGNEPIVRDTA